MAATVDRWPALSEETRSTTMEDLSVLGGDDDLFPEYNHLQQQQPHPPQPRYADRLHPDDASAAAGWEDDDGASSDLYVPAPSVSMSDLPEDLLDQYVMSSLLGEGSFGTVRLAYHKLTGQKVAIKIVDKTELDAYDHVQPRMEMHLLRSLNHPHIVRCLDWYEDGNFIIGVLEYCGHGELFDRIVLKRKLSEREAARFLAQLISALNYCHEHRLCHRDIKPENILLDGKDNVKLIDFGLCGKMAEGSTDFRFATVCGSTLYTAPEILTGYDGAVAPENNRDFDYNGAQADAWSVGVVCFAMLFGYVPVKADSPLEMFRALNGKDIKIPSGLTSEATDFLKQLLRYNPDKRLPLKDAFDHPWLAVTADETIQELSLPAPELDESVLAALCDFYLIDDARELLDDHELSIGAEYFLLLKAKQKNSNVTLPRGRGCVVRRNTCRSPLSRQSEPTPYIGGHPAEFCGSTLDALSEGHPPCHGGCQSESGYGRDSASPEPTRRAPVAQSDSGSPTRRGKGRKKSHTVTGTDVHLPMLRPPRNGQARTAPRRKTSWRSAAFSMLRQLAPSARRNSGLPRVVTDTNVSCFQSLDDPAKLVQDAVKIFENHLHAQVVNNSKKPFVKKVILREFEGRNVRLKMTLEIVSVGHPSSDGTPPTHGIVLRRLRGNTWDFGNVMHTLQFSLLNASAASQPSSPVLSTAIKMFA